jgi:phosphoglycolate phosphatase
MQPAIYLLDLDGTLTDPFTGISRCIAHALEALRMPIPDDPELRKWIGPPLKQSFQLYFDSHGGGDADQAVRLYRERFATVGLFENSVYDGIPELLEMLCKRSARLMLATAKPEIYAQQIVRHFGLDQWLEAVYGSELDGRRTDKVDLLGHIMHEQRLCPAECLMVGDREHDMIAARYHGMGAIGVLWGYGTPVELLEAGAETLVLSPAELMDLLMENQAEQAAQMESYSSI